MPRKKKHADDVTRRKQAEKRLRESEEKYQLLVEASPYAIVQSNLDGQISMCNAQAARMHGYGSPQELIGQSVFALFPPDELERARINMQKTLEDGIVRNVEYYLVKKDGVRFPAELSAAVIPDAAGQPAAFMALTNDITARKQAEDALRKSEVKFRAVVENSSNGIVFLDAGRKITYASPVTVQFLGFTPEELGGYAGVHPEDQELVAQKFTELLLTPGKTTLAEYRLRRKDGSYGWIETTAVNLLDNPDVQAIVLSERDIAERKQAEDKLKEYSDHLAEMVAERTRELQEAQEKLVRQEKLALLGQLAGGVGHELRNPLGVINNAVYYLKLVQPGADEKVKHYHAMIEQEVHNASRIIGDLLDFARVISSNPQALSVPDLVQRSLRRFPVPATLQVALDIPADLPQVYADPLHMEQVLGNLVTNACQAMPKGGTLAIRAQPAAFSAGHPAIRIQVEDTGTGITPENMQKLFEPLFTTKTNGIGLGLAVSKKLVEANAGRIEAESQPGRGSMFTLVLPVDPAASQGLPVNALPRETA
ncbi:MAG: PAS domain S-box protein [Anaerolineales bacterium]